MTITYSPEEDTLRILFRNAPIHESEVHRSGLILDFDQHGGILGLELASASEHVSGADALAAMTTARREVRPAAAASAATPDSGPSLQAAATATPS
ncbi:MAG TPA: DUF2283 domain-containing protein [Armatimonadaceae bacterium]|nr:DUF2283 domain-containing protein [Armatimonadaceae bacterium]